VSLAAHSSTHFVCSFRRYSFAVYKPARGELRRGSAVYPAVTAADDAMMKVMRCCCCRRRRRRCCYCCCSTESSPPQFPPPPPPPPPWLNRGASCCIKSRQMRPIHPCRLSAAAIGLDAFFLRFCGHSPSQGRASPSPSPSPSSLTNMTSITPSATAQPAVTPLPAGAWFRLPHRRRRVRGAAAGAPHDSTRVRLLKKCNTLLRRSLGSTRL